MIPRATTLRRWWRRITGDRRATSPHDPVSPTPSERAADHRMRATMGAEASLDVEALTACSADVFEEFARRADQEVDVEVVRVIREARARRRA